MYKKIILSIVCSSILLGCKTKDIEEPLDIHVQTSFSSLSAMKIAVSSCEVKRMEISQMQVQKLSNNVIKTIDFNYNYNPSVAFFTPDGTGSLDLFAFPNNAVTGKVGTYDSATLVATINGQSYQGVLTMGNYNTLVGGLSNKRLVFSQPLTAVPGVSGNYQILINALNAPSTGFPRPNLNIPTDLKVIGFNTITFYLY